MARQSKLQRRKSQLEAPTREKNDPDFIQERFGHAIDRLRSEERIGREELAKLLSMGATTLDRAKVGTEINSEGEREHIYDWEKVSFTLENLVAVANRFDMNFVEFTHYLIHGEQIKSDEEMQLDAFLLDFVEQLRLLRGIDRIRFLVSSTAFLKMNSTKTINAIIPLLYLYGDDIVDLANDVGKKIIEKNQRT